MMKNFIFVLTILFSISCSVRKNAVEQAEIMTNAIIHKQYDVTLKYTHPGVVKLIGGEKNFIEILKTGNEEMVNIGNAYESIVIGKPSKRVKAGNEIHCLMPETITMKLKEGKMVNKSYLLAVSTDKGKNWTFIETALLNDDNIFTILPSYNKELKLPEKEVPQYFK